MKRVSFFLLLISIILGPLYAGSYYEHWRIPLLIVSSLSVITLTAISGKYIPKSRLLFLTIITLSAQGIWMWYNAWGEFSDENTSSAALPWQMKLIDDQPAAAMPGAPDRGEAWDRISYILICLWLVWATRSLIISQGKKVIHTLLKTVFCTGIAISALGFIQQWTHAESIFWSDALKSPYDLFFATYRSPGIASCYLNITLASGLAILFGAKSESRKNNSATLSIGIIGLKILGITMILSAIMATGSKAGSALGIITLIFWILLNYKGIISAYHQSLEYFPGNRQLERNIVTCVLAIVIAFAVLTSAGTTIARWNNAQQSQFETLATRMAINEIVIESLSDPKMEWGTLGHGPGAFYCLFSIVNKHPTEQTRGVFFYTHNDFLQTLFEWGWFGFSLFTILIGGGCWLIVRELIFHKRQHHRSNIVYLRGCLIAMVIMLSHAMVDFPFQIESIAITFSIILGVAWAAPSLRLATKKHPKVRKPS